MLYNVAIENLRHSRRTEEKLNTANRLTHYLDRSGDEPNDTGFWDYRLLIREDLFGLETPEFDIQSPWTFCVTFLKPDLLGQDLVDVRWRELGDSVVRRGATYTYAGVETELETFLRNRRLERRSGHTRDRHVERIEPKAHVFISYVSEDALYVDRIQTILEEEGISVWRDRSSLGAGDRWKQAIKEAIESGAYFMCCFSKASGSRAKSYMNEELTIAIDELRTRPRDRVWFLPVVLPGGSVPNWRVSSGESLHDFNYIELEDVNWAAGLRSLIDVIKSPQHDAQ